ncbi:MAG: hypothetical protein OIF50_13025, partial [Flavobacteriaceae bacterium]|nr:hypothetical protein [Flavobacteriaceae bacterium]
RSLTVEKDYKHIDRLYQEKFKDFDPKPDTSNWEQIAARIDNKKRRRIIPIWWRFGGVAAVLALVLYLFIPKNVVVQAPSETQISDVVPQQKNLENKPIHNKQAVVETTTDSKEYNIGTTKPSGLVPKNSVSDNTGIVARNSKKPEPKYKKVAPPTAKEEASVAQTEKVVIRPTNPQEENVLNKTTKKQETIAQNALEEAINILEEEAETEVVAAPKAKSKWSVTPNIAPVYYNNFGTGSPVSEEFVQNDKSGQFQMSYGIHVAYDMGKKWALRTGLNNVNLSYATNGVQFTTAAASAEAVNQEMNIN